jgi:excisionase family DNA binding protein
MARLRNDSGLLGTCEAARYLAVHRSTLDFWRRRNQLIPTRIVQGQNGTKFLFSREDLDAFRKRIDYDR